MRQPRRRAVRGGRVQAGAAEDRGTVLNHHPEPRGAAQAAARNREAAELLRRLIREPEPDERPERKREENLIVSYVSVKQRHMMDYVIFVEPNIKIGKFGFNESERIENRT